MVQMHYLGEVLLCCSDMAKLVLRSGYWADSDNWRITFWAETLRTCGDPTCARLWDIATVEPERAWQAFSNDTLSLTEAARESGFTADHLGALILGRCATAAQIRRAEQSS
jgi:hypothetical protein